MGWDRVFHLSATTETIICIIVTPQALGVPGTSIHIIGVSLGAHVGGLVGHFHSGRLGRITGIIKLRLGSSPGLPQRERKSRKGESFRVPFEFPKGSLDPSLWASSKILTVPFQHQFPHAPKRTQVFANRPFHLCYLCKLVPA